MAVTTSRRRLRRAAAVAALLLLVLTARAARAQTPPETLCFNQLTSCYYWAAVQSGFWNMWASGLDCELQFTSCVRIALIGR